MRKLLYGVTMLALVLLWPGELPAQTAEPVTVEVGVLTCVVGESASDEGGEIVALECDFDRIGDAPNETYAGEMHKLVLNDGLAPKSTMIWQVMAASTDLEVGALTGAYQGAAVRGADDSADTPRTFLQGGADEAIALLPLSDTAQEIMKLAAVTAKLVLKTVKA